MKREDIIAIIVVFVLVAISCVIAWRSNCYGDTTAQVTAQGVRLTASGFGLERVADDGGAAGSVSRYGLEISTHHGATEMSNSFADGATSVDLTYAKNPDDLIGLSRFNEAGGLSQYTAERCRRQAWGSENQSRATEIKTRMGGGVYSVESAYGDRMAVTTAQDTRRKAQGEAEGELISESGEQSWRLEARDYTDLLVEHLLDLEFAAGDVEDEIGIEGLCPKGWGD